jgi:hypothetical protein
MAKQEVVKNLFDDIGSQIGIYDKKYFKYLPVSRDNFVTTVLNAVNTGDLPTIENSLRPLANASNNFMYVLGMVCYIIETERLYEGSEFGWSYLRYAEHLTEELNIPIATISEAKVLMEIYIQYNPALVKAGFKMERNASKLRYLPEALENHREEEVYDRIVNKTFREFRDWAQKKNLAHRASPGPETRVNVTLEGNKLLVDGKNIINFPKGTYETIIKMVSSDLERTFSIREGGNIPFIVGTYDNGEQIAIENFLKKHRAKK